MSLNQSRKEQVINLYLKNKYSEAIIATKVGCTKATVIRHIKNYTKDLIKIKEGTLIKLDKPMATKHSIIRFELFWSYDNSSLKRYKPETDTLKHLVYVVSDGFSGEKIEIEHSDGTVFNIDYDMKTETPLDLNREFAYEIICKYGSGERLLIGNTRITVERFLNKLFALNEFGNEILEITIKYPDKKYVTNFPK